MRVLIIKMSSMGDILHCLPALTDAGRHHAKLSFDWVVEESFVEIPNWHPLVNTIIPVALRRWKRSPLKAIHSGEWRKFRKQLRSRTYDVIIDAQGLMKSALLTRIARGKRCGLDHLSAWEILASVAYQVKASVQPEQHAITRMRQLFSQLLEYPCPNDTPDYGIAKDQFQESLVSLPDFSRPKDPFVLFFHGTTWQTKHWPVSHWQALLTQAVNAGYSVLLPWSNAVEFDRATQLAATQKKAKVLPKLNLMQLASLLTQATGSVAVDTGLGHLAAALNVPTLSIYGPTNPVLTGTQGKFQQHVTATFNCAPCLSKTCSYTGNASVHPACFGATTPLAVWQQFENLLQLAL